MWRSCYWKSKVPENLEVPGIGQLIEPTYGLADARITQRLQVEEGAIVETSHVYKYR